MGALMGAFAVGTGNSIFFHVKRIEDPIGLLPAKLILGINKRGVHFFRPARFVLLRVSKVTKVVKAVVARQVSDSLASWD